MLLDHFFNFLNLKIFKILFFCFLEMAFVLVDSEAYKISLEIVEDFINFKYDDFIQQEPTEEVKIIKWELLIKFKLLENKNDSTIKYYINFFKSLFEPLLKYNSFPSILFLPKVSIPLLSNKQQ